MDKMKIAVIGGDLRSIMLVKMLRADGNYVKTFGLELSEDMDISDEFSLAEAVRDCDIIIGPIPVSEDSQHIRTPFSKKVISFERLIKVVGEASPQKPPLFIAGKVQDIVPLCGERLRVIDFLEREDMAILNAVPTAEGALQIALEKTRHTIRDSRCLVLGYGRIGKVLARMLADLGAEVTVAARKFADIARIRNAHHTPVKFTEVREVLPVQDVIFNTVPVTVLAEEALDTVKKSCLIIDLASKPGGVDFKYAESLGLNVIWALSLPGKVAPISAGRIMKETLYNIVEECKYTGR